MIDQNMIQFLAGHPGLKYAFFGGKGGVGKTVLAGAAALWLARQGKRTLLASTNPVHSLTSMLDQDVFGKPTPVNGVPNLWAHEIDTRETIEKSKKEIREKIEWFLRFADIKTKADEFVASATMNPAFEESAMFENMIDIMFEDKYKAYVFDTAPTANARRLLGMSSVYGLWVNKMMQSRQEAQSLRELLSFSKKKEKKRPTDGIPGQFPPADGERQNSIDRRFQDRLLFRYPTGGPAHRRHQALHRLVPRLWHPRGRRGGQHAH